MPAGYTHYVFGEQVLDQLDESIKKRIMPYIDLYHIGIHGPDILFYYDVYKKNPVKSLGFGMHQLPQRKKIPLPQEEVPEIFREIHPIQQ